MRVHKGTATTLCMTIASDSYSRTETVGEKVQVQA